MKLNNEEIVMLKFLVLQGIDSLTKSTGPVWIGKELNPKYTIEFKEFIQKVVRVGTQINQNKKELVYGIWNKEYLKDIDEYWTPCLKSVRKDKIHPNANIEKYGKEFTINKEIVC